mgnify:CR=1 FL=1
MYQARLKYAMEICQEKMFSLISPQGRVQKMEPQA